jgi:hypothetical protein
MARIAGVDLPKKKRLEYALTYILWYRFAYFTQNFGCNWNRLQQACTN